MTDAPSPITRSLQSCGPCQRALPHQHLPPAFNQVTREPTCSAPSEEALGLLLRAGQEGSGWEPGLAACHPPLCVSPSLGWFPRVQEEYVAGGRTAGGGPLPARAADRGV